MIVHFNHKDVPFSDKNPNIRDTSKLEDRISNLTNEVNRLSTVIRDLQIEFEENELLVGAIESALEWGNRVFDRKLVGVAEKAAATDRLAEELVRLTAFIATLEEKRKALRSEISNNRLYIKGMELAVTKERAAYVASKEHKELSRQAAKPAKRRHQLAKKIRENEVRKKRLQDRLSDVEATLARVKSE